MCVCCCSADLRPRSSYRLQGFVMSFASSSSDGFSDFRVFQSHLPGDFESWTEVGEAPRLPTSYLVLLGMGWPLSLLGLGGILES